MTLRGQGYSRTIISFFVDGGEQDLVKVDGPDAVSDLLEAEVEVLQGQGEEDQVVPESDGTGAGDVLDHEVARVLDGRQGVRMGPRGTRGSGSRESRRRGPRGAAPRYRDAENGKR